MDFEIKEEKSLNILDTYEDDIGIKYEDLLDTSQDIPDYVDLTQFITTADVKEERLDKDEETIYHCPYCTANFEFEEVLQLHSMVHNKLILQSKLCPICGAAYAQKKYFEVHLRGHVKEKMIELKKNAFMCRYCNKHFIHKRKLIIHNRVHTNERPWVCEVCHKGFKQKGSLSSHIKTHTKVKGHICSKCSGDFATASSLRRHIRRIHDKGKYFDCRSCDKKFYNKEAVQRHTNQEHPPVTFSRHCQMCGDQFFTISSYKKHRKAHRTDINSTSTNYYSCPLCEETLPDYKLLRKHTDAHLLMTAEELERINETKTFTCKLCAKVFLRKPSLFYHMDKHRAKTYSCEFCKEKFTFYSLNLHKTNFHESFKCNFCGTTLIGKKQYDIHIEKNHQHVRKMCVCKFCNKGFPAQRHLNTHITRQHQHEKKPSLHKCRICRKCYPTKNILQEHKRRVHKSFTCNLCEKEFSNRLGYILHFEKTDCLKKADEGNEELKCALCRNISLRTEIFTKHITNHKCYFMKCTYCDKSFFGRPSHLAIHIRRVHPDKNSEKSDLSSEHESHIEEPVHMVEGCDETSIEVITVKVEKDIKEIDQSGPDEIDLYEHSLTLKAE